MAKTASPAPSAGSSGDPQHQKPGPKPKYSHQQSSSSAPPSSTSSNSKLPLPQCKVKRNYACAKCPYYTQNPRSFLHHQKNVHAERLKVYECSHCLYASKHSQKLQRHVQMVHQSNKSGKNNHGFDDSGKPLLVPPVRIRVQRFEKFTDQHLAKLVIVEDVDVDETEVVTGVEEESGTEEHIVSGVEEGTEEEAEPETEADAEEDEDELDDEEAGGEEEQDDEEEDEPEDEADLSNDGSGDADDRVPAVSLLQTAPPTPPPAASQPPPQQQKKSYKQDKQSVTFIQCSVCPFGSHSRTLVNRHEKSAHLKKKFFRCMKCNYVTHMRARYTKHVKYHTMPMIKCDDCDFRTPYKWNLDRHNRNHSVIAPGTYKCSHCSFSADIKQSLTVHETNHHVPPVGGVFPANGTNRRRYRVGASDAPGSAVDGTEIVTYETTKEGGIVEIMTETKSASPSVSASGGGSMSKVATTKIGGTSSTCTVVKKTTTTTTTAASLPPAPIKIISVTSPPEGNIKTAEQKPASRRRPMPKLIPIVDQQQQQQRRVPTVVRMRLPATTTSSTPPPQDNASVVTADDYYSLTAGQSALSDFASIIDDADCASGPFNSTGGLANAAGSGLATPGTTADRRRSSSSAGSSSTTSSPKSKTASFFDKLKAKVDETADLTCKVCRHESKCLSEFMRHQRTHGANGDDDAATATADSLKIERTATTQERTPTPPPPVTASELKSTRCQRCRKRCKTSAELLVHLATCRGANTAVSTTAAAIDISSQSVAAKEIVTDEDLDTQQHPMENKIFVWNTAAVTTPPQGDDDNDDDCDERDSVTVTEIGMPPNVESPSADREPHDESEDDTNDTPDTNNPSDRELLIKHQEQLKHAIRKEGKMYKTVFKCPHCTFWAATASRFHVHIVGHLNRKPFECSCCAYRSNWRWDITKHIRLKSARKGGAEESVAVANSHQGAKVLMTDETGRRNYSKYNRYLTVMEMDIADGADKAAGGECEDGKGVRKSVGGGIARKRRAPAFVYNKGATSSLKQHQSQTSLTGRAAAVAGQLKRFKAAAIRNQQLNQHMTHNAAASTSNPPSATGGDNRSKTVWKCKKCFFRDCDRLTVLNHVKAHYRRGEFGSNTSATRMNSSQHNDGTTAIDISTNAINSELYVQTKKSVEKKETTEKNSPTIDRRKTKTPTTGSTSDTLLLLSTNPKSLMLYDDENFLSCPLCDVTAASPGQLKEHMQRTHIPEETKYRCEYCPFWSEEKKAMLDHMMFAHEMDDGSVNTDVNATDVNYGTEQRDESASNSINYDDEEEMQIIDENGSSNEATANMTMFDNGSDDTNVTTNMEVLFDTSDDNIVVVETVECKPDFVDNDGGSTIETSSIPSKSSEKSSFSSTAADEKITDNMISCEYDGVEEPEEDEQVEDEEIIVRAEEVTEPTSVKIIKATFASTTSEGNTTTVSRKEIEVFECNECWYYSTSRRDLLAHKQLHNERGALYSCTECVFNVTKSAILYHHYRHGHVIEEPELLYPEDSIVRAGQRDMNAKNSENKLENKTANATDVDETTGPPMVWHYRKENIPPFTKVFKCRYCPHTNRRRHNTVEHERMHSDHPDHQNHRQMQQRLSGCSVPPSPLHPCKRCTYVCNNAGVLASHVKVHSTSYSCSTVGFYDITVVDSVQIRAIEYVMELEKRLLLDKNTATNSGLLLSSNEVLSDSSSDNESPEDVTKYTEIDEPELKFCPYCPARYFFRADLRFHIRFHRFRGWKNACDCCSFVARARSHVNAHEIVHCDEYAQRTTELLTSGYPVNPKYPRRSEYPALVNDDPPQLQRRPGSPPQLLDYKHSKTLSSEPDGQRQRRTKRVRHSEPNVATAVQPPSTEDVDDNSKRRRRSMTVGVAMKTANAKPPPPALLPVSKMISSKSPAPKTTVATAIKSTSGAAVKPVTHKTTSGATGKVVKTTKASYTRQFMCTMCPGKFFKSTALQYHKTLHGGPGRHKCRCCDYAVSTYGNLVRHEAVHRDLPVREKIKNKTSKKMKALSKLKARGKKIPLSATALTTSTPLDAKGELSDENDDDDDDDDDEELGIDPEFGSIMLGNPSFFYPTTIKNGVIRSKRYKCPKCPSAFDKRDQYVVHLTLHGAVDKYQCDKCDYAVRYTANYVQHQRKHARDAEIRKNNAQAADRAKMIKEQEEAANAQRIRKRPTAEDRKPLRTTKPVVKLQPQDTAFTNEISDQQTAYELNAAYGATGNLVGETTTSLFRCAHCPFECDIRSQLDRHNTHHYAAMNSSGAASKRSWKRSCRFCTYRTHGEVDLVEHTRVHFLRSTGEPVTTNEEHATDESTTATVPTNVGDYVEFHGKRVVYSQRRRNNNTDDQEAAAAAENLDEGDIEPFFVFKDCGDVRYRTDDNTNGMTTAAIIRSHNKRFSPDCPPPQMAIDYNDNRTGDGPKVPPAAFVRFFDSGTRLEFLGDDSVEPMGKRKRSSKK
ncbi:uncharacterized protein LOC113559426 isoform X2 [Rhopalosiphum maidis]|nr:uncharacterized protein LOC113559426 isoform X2 [Rhopalosiphum maidis]XP_026821045.1 uncharacterized protein LOC113559426 isoform X2 [Rhopalosiphum maidis]